MELIGLALCCVGLVLIAQGAMMRADRLTVVERDGHAALVLSETRERLAEATIRELAFLDAASQVLEVCEELTLWSEEGKAAYERLRAAVEDSRRIYD